MRGILPSTVAVTGQVNAAGSGTVTTVNAGQGYVGEKPLFVTEAVATSDTYNGGLRYRTDGALRVVDATAGLPANASINQEGIAQSTTGQVCYTSDAVAAGSPIHGGVATTHDGRLYASIV
jgi:hypothetical protein